MDLQPRNPGIYRLFPCDRSHVVMLIAICAFCSMSMPCNIPHETCPVATSIGSIQQRSVSTNLGRVRYRHMTSICSSSSQRCTHRCLSVSELVARAEVGEPLGIEYDKTFGDNNSGRRMGLILHPTSLPGPYGSGEIGQECRRMIDWISSAGMQCWQVLPVVPPDQMYYSPYTGLDANCGNTLLISLEELAKENLLEYHELPGHLPVGKADFESASDIKKPLLSRVANRILKEEHFGGFRVGMEVFRRERPWVEDSALFECFRVEEDEAFAGKVWWEWPEEIRFREESAMDAARERYKTQMDEFIVCQYLFHRQWKSIKVATIQECI